MVLLCFALVRAARAPHLVLPPSLTWCQFPVVSSKGLSTLRWKTDWNQSLLFFFCFIGQVLRNDFLGLCLQVTLGGASSGGAMQSMYSGPLRPLSSQGKLWIKPTKEKHDMSKA